MEFMTYTHCLIQQLQHNHNMAAMFWVKYGPTLLNS